MKDKTILNIYLERGVLSLYKSFFLICSQKDLRAVIHLCFIDMANTREYLINILDWFNEILEYEFLTTTQRDRMIKKLEIVAKTIREVDQ